MKYLVLSIFSAAILSSCAPTSNSDAEAVCNCFNKSTVDQERVEIAVDSCMNLYKQALTKFDGDAVAKKEFVAAYDYCRNN